MALPGRGMFAMTWREQCRRPAAGAKGGKGTVWFPCPLLTPPKPSFALRLPSVARRNGSYGDSVPGVGQILGRCQALRSACVNHRA